MGCQEGEIHLVVPAADNHHRNRAGFDSLITVFEGIPCILDGDEKGVRSRHGDALSCQGANNRMDFLPEFFADDTGGILGGETYVRAADEGGLAVLGI